MGEALRDIGQSPWLRYWDELQIHSLYLNKERTRSLTAAETLTALLGLSFHGSADDDAVQAIAAAPLPKLQAFGLNEVMFRDEPRLTPAVIDAILGARWLEQLQGLSLFGDWLGDEGLRALAACHRLTRLESLEIRPLPACWSGAGMRALLQSPHFPALTLLNIAFVDLTPENAALLAQPDVLPKLETVVLSFDDVKYRELLEPRFGQGLYFGSLERDEA